MKKVAVLIGSLRGKSYSSAVARNLVELAPADLAFETIEIGQLPFYNEDQEAETPEQWQTFRQRVSNADAVLFVTPEYNRSMPAVLKNALDVGSRPYGQSIWKGKPAVVVSISIGNLAGFGVNHHVRQSLVFLDMPTMPQPELYLANVQTLLDHEGRLSNANTTDFLRAAMAKFERWIDMTGEWTE